MKQSGRSTLFILVCIAVLTAAYGVGLGVRKLRLAGVNIQISMGTTDNTPAGKPVPASTPDTTDTPVAPPPPMEATPEEGHAQEPANTADQTVTVPPERPEITAVKDRWHNATEQEPQALLAKKRPSFGGKGPTDKRNERRGDERSRGLFQQLPADEQARIRSQFEALGAKVKAGEISQDEWRQARMDLMREHGINPQQRGMRRPGGRQ